MERPSLKITNPVYVYGYDRQEEGVEWVVTALYCERHGREFVVVYATNRIEPGCPLCHPADDMYVE